MHITKNGYVQSAVLLIPFAKKLREHVEFEKFMCRIAVDNEITEEFRNNTEELKDKRYSLRYNNPTSESLTEKGKKKNDKQ